MSDLNKGFMVVNGHVIGLPSADTKIDDGQVSTDTAWSSKKTSDELGKKQDKLSVRKVYARRNSNTNKYILLATIDMRVLPNIGQPLRIKGVIGNMASNDTANVDLVINARNGFAKRMLCGTITNKNGLLNDANIIITKSDDEKTAYVYLNCISVYGYIDAELYLGSVHYSVPDTFALVETMQGTEYTNLLDNNNVVIEVGINDTTSSTTSTYSSVKIDEKYGAYTFGTANATQWLKLTLGNSSKFQPIVVSDQYGGKVEITGMADDGTYKPVKLIRYSYGDWTTYSATDYTTTDQGDANYKIRRLYYYPAGSCYYLEIRQYCTIKVSGAISKPEMVASLPAETSAMTLISESQFASKTDLNLTTKLAQGGSPFAEMYASESPYRKLTARCYYGRQQVLKVIGSNGYSGKIFVVMHGVELNNAVVKVVTENGTAPFELKYGNTKALTGSGYYSIDLFIHKTKPDVITLNIIPVAQGMSPYTITYTSADFVTSTATDFESAEKTATFTSEYATKADLGESEWTEATLNSYAVAYDDNNKPAYKKVGNAVYLTGIIKPSSDTNSFNTSNGHTIFTLPVGYRPSRQVNVLCQGTMISTWLLTINTNGAVVASRYRQNISTTVEFDATSPPTTTWMPFSISFAL